MSQINFEEDLFDPTDRTNYDEFCELVASLSNDPAKKDEINQILKTGHIDNYTPRGFLGRDDEDIEFNRRLWTALLIATNYDTFNYIKNNNILYFHGTNANAIPGIRYSGVRPLTNIINSGQTINTGETWSRFDGRRDFISFTDDLSLATGYSSLKPTINNPYEDMYNFPIVIGMTKSNVISSDARPIHSDRQEVGLYRDVPLEKISVILVPSDKLDFVRKIFNGTVTVLPYDVKSHDKFCYLNGPEVKIYHDQFESFKESLIARTKSINTVDDVVKKRKASGIMGAINKFKGLFGKEDSVYDQSGPNR